MSIDELEAAGMSRMTDEEIRAFLSTQGEGVLGLPAEGGAGDAPYMIPLSFGYDGESTLYFTFVLGSESRKEALSDRATVARFLVYNASSPFTWQSVLLTGRIEVVPDDERDDVETALENAWRPDIFESVELTRGVEVYRFRAEDLDGVKHTGIPPGLDGERDGLEDPD